MAKMQNNSVRRLLLEALEPRFVLSADGGIVIVDQSLPDQQLIRDAAGPDSYVLLFDSRSDSLADIIAAAIRTARDSSEEIGSISVLSHGSAGRFVFGNQTVTLETVTRDSDLWREFGQAFRGATLNLFGCEVGAGMAGRELVERLGEITRLNVYASDDLTGQGGDWELEVASAGGPEQLRPLNVDLLAGVDATLVDVNVVPTGDFESGSLAGWERLDPGTPTISQVDVQAGAYSIYFDADIANSYARRSFNTVAGQTYQVSAWIRIVNEVGADWGGVKVGITDGGTWTGLGNRENLRQSGIGSNWYNVTFNFTAISSRSRITVQAFHGPALDMYFYADSITVTGPANQAPTGVDDSYATNEETALVVPAAGVLTNDTDIEGDARTAVLVSGPSHGSLTFNADGSFTYTPEANYHGPDSFVYKPKDFTEGNETTVNLTVNNVNDAPTGTNDAYVVVEDGGLNVPAGTGVLANDDDIDNDPITAVLDTDVSHGTLVLNPNGSFTYTPDANYNGPDSFTYHVNDGTDNSASITVNITVTPDNDAPTGTNDAYVVVEDGGLNVPAGTGVLANDDDIDNDPITAVLDTDVSHGTLVLNPNGSFTYTPDANHNGPDSFTYHVNDGTDNSASITVNITVTPDNDAPTGTNDAYVVVEDGGLNVPAGTGVLANDDDIDNDPITAVLDTDVSHGTLVLNPNGSFTYTPDANYNGPDSFTYHVNDGTDNSASITVNITVTSDNDAPTGTNDAYVTSEDGSLNLLAPGGVLANDFDIDGDLLNVLLDTDVSHGTLTFNPDGSFTYRSLTDYYGPDSFTYYVTDGTDTSGPYTVNITVLPTNDSPVAFPDAYNAVEDMPLTVPVNQGLLANDVDIDNDPLQITLTLSPRHGQLVLSPDGSFIYTPDPNYCGVDSFTYRITDGALSTSSVTVALTVTPRNDAPVALPDSFTLTEDNALRVVRPGILFNDYDIDGDAISAILGSGPAHGELFLNADGSFRYVPDSDYNGTDSFTYFVTDGAENSVRVTVTLTIVAKNDAPTGPASAFMLPQGTSLMVPAATGLIQNFIDVDGDAISAILVSAPEHGSLTLNPDGSFTYTPDLTFWGADSFIFKASDGTAAGQEVTATITVTRDYPAVLELPGPQNTSGTVRFSAFSTNPIIVRDAEADLLDVTLGSTSGLLSLGSVAGLRLITGDGLADPVIRFTGTIAQVNAALEGLAFAPGQNTTQLIIRVHDGVQETEGTVVVHLLPPVPPPGQQNNVVVLPIIITDDLPPTVPDEPPADTQNPADGRSTNPTIPDDSDLPATDDPAPQERDGSNQAKQPDQPANPQENQQSPTNAQQPSTPQPQTGSGTASTAAPAQSPAAPNAPAAPTSVSQANVSAPVPVSPPVIAVPAAQVSIARAAAEQRPADPTVEIAPAPESIIHVTREVAQQVQAVQQQVDSAARTQKARVATTTGAVVVMSAGYVVWCIKSGLLLASTLASLPIWRWLDPLPVLESWQKAHKQRSSVKKTDEDEEEKRIKSLVESAR